MTRSLVAPAADLGRPRWAASYSPLGPTVRRCAIEQLAAGVARALVAAQTALDLRADERMKGWEEEGIPPSAMMLGTCKLRFNVSPAITGRRDARERTRILIAPRRSGANQLALVFRRVRQERVRS